MAEHRHKREPHARLLDPRGARSRAALVAAPTAVVLTAAAVTIGIATAQPGSQELPSAARAGDPTTLPDLAELTDRVAAISRSSLREHEPVRGREGRGRHAGTRAERSDDRRSQTALERVLAGTGAAVRRADLRLWATAPLNLWTLPSGDARRVGLVEEGTRVLVTGRSFRGRQEVVVDGRARWVTNGYLSDEKPVSVLARTAGLSAAPCPDSSVESGLTEGAVAVYRAVCHAFPQITTYGGWSDHGEHASGRAIDIMTSDVELGTAIADFLVEHAADLGLYDVIWRQHIWTPERASEGWRLMPSQGDATADHYDHVHVSVS